MKLLLLLLVLMVSAGCAADEQADPADTDAGEQVDSIVDEYADDFGAKEDALWSSLSPSEQDDYRRAFDYCNNLVSPPEYRSAEAVEYADAMMDQGERGSEVGCRDGISGLPLEASGVPTPP